MSKIKYIQVLSTFVLLFLSSCKEDRYSEIEHYKHVIYLLSENSYNVASESYPFNDGKEVVGYFSIGCGGSLTNPEEVVVELGPETELFPKYNRFNFDIDESKYARLLPKERYRIVSDKIIFPARNPDQYVKVAVTVLPDGLSPDSTYFIPIAIKSVSRYEVNPKKSSILFRIGLENYYAEHLNDTYYQMRGSQLNEAGVPVGTISATKLVRPLTRNKIRLFAGGETQTPTTKPDVIRRQSIVLTINENKEVKIEPYGTIQIDQMPVDENWNRYVETPIQAGQSGGSGKMAKYIYLYYRFRTLTPATETTPEQYSSWSTVKEVLKRLE